MLQLAHIRENKAAVIAALQKRNIDAESIISQVIALDEERRTIQHTLDQNLSEAKKIAAEIGKLFQEGKTAEANAAKAKTGDLKTANQELDAKMKAAQAELNALLATIPNTPHASVPAGKSADDNETVRTWGEASNAAHATPHWDLTTKYKLIDFELGVKIAGAGFPVYMGKGAKLQRALIQFFLDEAEAAGFSEVIPPHLVNEDSGFGTGQLPDKDGQMYHATVDNLFLIPTAEVPITNIYRDVILDEEELPIKNSGYTPCFRREAGSYGKEVRGLNRLHQFDKVEIVQISKPENSYQLLEEMVAHVEGLLKKLELPYRVLRLCGGDMGFTSALTYDLEVYSAGQGRWLEVSSVSNFETYQANRMKLRIKDKDGNKQMAHTLNGSALALPRIVAALLENNFDGEKIVLPKAITPYTKFETIE
ncbi:MAG: serine--tRNA ligase [Salibacteraceae bacterium]|nr:serine--tRNA ligase [Salibacteraceae bacterium]MDP4687562.1 serine--tRNA ligase [Salibacteraceae bacterium]MDP4762609.1 serine--tRNA ligase [Salibacteraceae bacterium]MDP4844904.1 serine--tRNA ligase [Salibacteraceae bacterium]MDP4934577.1 serine--tRNA ligase [Salibacteraceae bacterium]